MRPLNGLVYTSDYPGLKNPGVIEELRKQMLYAFRAYTTGWFSNFCMFFVIQLCIGTVEGTCRGNFETNEKVRVCSYGWGNKKDQERYSIIIYVWGWFIIYWRIRTRSKSSFERKMEVYC